MTPRPACFAGTARAAAAALAVAGLAAVMAAPAQADTARAAAARAGASGAAPAGPRGTHQAGPLAVPDAGITFPLHTSGASVVDASGSPVKLNLVNWYGAESPDYVVGGLAYQPVSEIISQIVSMGFNGVRLPWSNQMWQSNPTISATYVKANPQFAGEPARTVFEQVVTDLAAAGLMVVLDNHNSDAEWCCSTTDGNTLWYNPAYPQSAWLSDWESMTRQFQNVPQVIGADLRNEPRGAASWGGSSTDDWHAAAQLGGNAILGIDPHWLIFVEGVNYGTDLSGAGSLPVTLSVSGQLVYSVHDYPWDFSNLTDYDSWAGDIGSRWGYLVGKDPLWVGEFGTCNTSSSCVSGGSGDGLWFGFITRFLRYHNVSWSDWAVNGTESDGLPGQGRSYGATETFGILNPQWDGAALAGLLSGLQGIQPACPASPLASGTYYIANRTSGYVIDIPGASKTQGTDLDQWPLNHGANQQWKLTSLGCGLYEITSVSDGQAMEIYNQSTGAGGRVDQWDYWGGGNQQFLITRNSAGYDTITNLNSMDLVEDPGFSGTAGTKLDQWPSNGGSNQQWTFTPVS